MARIENLAITHNFMIVKGAKHERICQKYLADNYDAYVKDLETLTNIDSGNGDREGTEAANKFVAEKCRL